VTRRIGTSGAAAPGTRILALAVAASLALLPGAAPACGLEDPNSIAVLRGSLQLAYPESLHVGTAVWQAQLAGALPRDPLAQRADLSPEARGKLRLLKANGTLRQMAARLATAPEGAAHPDIALVLLGPVMWTRFETAGGDVRATPHVPGPQPGDVVVVTDIPVVEAIASGEMNFADALGRGVMRLYGSPADVAAVRSWLEQAGRA
jgi:hypothetical protein